LLQLALGVGNELARRAWATGWATWCR